MASPAHWRQRPRGRGLEATDDAGASRRRLTLPLPRPRAAIHPPRSGCGLKRTQEGLVLKILAFKVLLLSEKNKN